MSNSEFSSHSPQADATAEPALAQLPALASDVAERLLRGESKTPHDTLGAHPATVHGISGVVVRARDRDAQAMAVLVDEAIHPMEREYGELFVCFIPHATLPMRYRLRAEFADGRREEYDDSYRFMPTLGDVDLHLFNEGRHLRLWEKLGAHPRVMDGVEGTSFAVWAPNATRVSVIGTFNGWDGRIHVMRMLGTSGVFEIFIPGIGAETLYKYEIRSFSGRIRIKTDPYAAKMEQAPGFASIVQSRGRHAWGDASWLEKRAEADPPREAMNVYEVHLASWMRGENNRLLSYSELAPRLAAHVTRLGFTHVELLPIQEHPFGGSWGYQVGGYFAPTSRHGTPDDFRAFVDTLHQAGIGVLLDWVPAHFPKDDWALRRFDGTACYEHEDPRLGDHPEWGTHIFNYARHEVRNFLLANALYWIEEFHIDGLRVDAVASMLYLDYGREAGQWLRNRYGGRENLEAVSFFKLLNHSVHTLYPGVVTIAEESTTWPKVTHPIADGGLGFTFKWNMGWMHDTLDYFRVDPFFRKGSHNKLTFAMMYEYSEKFMNPLSHDEVVHLKKSLLDKMPGDAWQRFANVRALIGYSITRPGKSLFFMGTEIAPNREWNHDVSLDWHLADDPRRQGIVAFMETLGALYLGNGCFWRHDHDPSGFAWIAVDDGEQSVLSYARFDGAAHAVVVLNLTPVPRAEYRMGAPASGTYRYTLNSDAPEFGGSGYATPVTVDTDDVPYHGFAQSMVLTLPPLSMLVLFPETVPADAAPIIAAAEVEELRLIVDGNGTPALSVDAAADAPGASSSGSKRSNKTSAKEPKESKKSKAASATSKAVKPVKIAKTEKADKATKPANPSKSAKPKKQVAEASPEQKPVSSVEKAKAAMSAKAAARTSAAKKGYIGETEKNRTAGPETIKSARKSASKATSKTPGKGGKQKASPEPYKDDEGEA
jgi:1,4-alpha-glucan branching enzyme